MPSAKKPKILIVEDEVLIAQDIKNCILKLGYEFAGCAYNSDKALDLFSNREIDFAILDINIDGSRDGIELATIINEKYNIPFIYLTSYSDEYTLNKAKPTLPYGYIVKPFDEKDLKTSIEMALYKFKSETEKNSISLEFVNQQCEKVISERELEIIQELLNGNTLSKIAENLFVSENTIKSHVRRIYIKLDVHNRVELSTKLLR